MIQITADFAKLYTSFMEQKGVETDQRQNKESLSAFLEKLKEKKQAESLRKQAHHAVSFLGSTISYGKSAAYGRTEPDISSSDTKKSGV